MSVMASQIIGVSIVCLNVCSDANQRKHQRSELLAFAREIHRRPVDSPHKGPVTRNMFPFNDVIMLWCSHGAKISSKTCTVNSNRLSIYHQTVPCFELLGYFPNSLDPSVCQEHCQYVDWQTQRQTDTTTADHSWHRQLYQTDGRTHNMVPGGLYTWERNG